MKQIEDIHEKVMAGVNLLDGGSHCTCVQTEPERCASCLALVKLEEAAEELVRILEDGP